MKPYPGGSPLACTCIYLCIIYLTNKTIFCCKFTSLLIHCNKIILIHVTVGYLKPAKTDLLVNWHKNLTSHNMITYGLWTGKNGEKWNHWVRFRVTASWLVFYTSVYIYIERERETDRQTDGRMDRHRLHTHTIQSRCVCVYVFVCVSMCVCVCVHPCVCVCVCVCVDFIHGMKSWHLHDTYVSNAEQQNNRIICPCYT